LVGTAEGQIPVEGEEEPSATAEDDRLQRAIRLFEFLARVQQIKSPTPRTFEAYELAGDVLWLHSLPDHPAIRSMHRYGGLDPAEPILTLDRVPHAPPPSPPDSVRAWLATGIDDPDSPPRLLNERVIDSETGPSIGLSSPESDEQPVEIHLQTQLLEDLPEVGVAFEQWMRSWSSWADNELILRPVREAYGRLFSIYIASTTHTEDLELVCGSACLGWKANQHERVQRHTFVSPTSIHFDDSSGRLTVRTLESTDRISLELDMLDPDLIRDPGRINDIREAARSLDSHPMDREEVSLLGRRLVHTLDPDGQYLDEDFPPTVGGDPIIAYAPAIILRKRSKQDLIRVFLEIASQMRAAMSVPEGLLPLVDPNHSPDPGLEWNGDEGAQVRVDDEIFLPLPVNKAQLQVINRVDRSAQILVQGPPGTGKTHTAAALISHLLAQGKRVLVTAQTDRALKEVRSKLPAAIKPLSVAVVGSGRDDMADLKIAVERIANAASEHDPQRSLDEIEMHLAEIDRLRRQRSDIHHQLIEARESEVRIYERKGISGTLASIALDHQLHHETFKWISECTAIPADSDSPLTSAEALDWHRLLLDESILTNESEARQQLPEPSTLPSPEDFSDLVATERAAKVAFTGFSNVSDTEEFEALESAPPEMRSALRSNFTWFIGEVTYLTRDSESWIQGAVRDILRRRSTPWRARQNQIQSLVTTAEPLLRRLGPVERVSCATAPTVLAPLALSVHGHLSNGAKIKVDSAGRPKLGAMTNKVVKAAEPLFANVRVDGVPPTTTDALDLFLTWTKAVTAIDELDRAWPGEIAIPAEDTLNERLYWHVSELEQLDRVVRLATYIDQLNATLASLGLRNVNWNNLDDIRRLTSAVIAIESKKALDAAEEPLLQLEESTRQAARWRNAAPCVRALEESVHARSSVDYGQAWDRLRELLRVRAMADRRDTLGARLEVADQNLVSEIRGHSSDPRWPQRLTHFEDAWRWAALGTWITGREQIDVNVLQRHLDSIEDAIRSHVEHVAAERAWLHAVSPSRMTGQSRADLEQYAQLVRAHGKGTSVKYGSQRRAEIKEAMDRCRPSVPVWILPIYRIAEQIRIAPDIFDVVVVDEASQAGLEATFLQYLAPKIVVIGDDKQVSPSAVGVDQQQLRDLANQYLYDDRYKASWQDPLRSLFDEAKMRYGGTTTLVEHRRCVPEIIGFSNRIAYEPEGIRLIPVRQYGVDRLEPIKPVFLSEGYTRGSTSRINPVECEAIVDQIEKCLADPAYDGLTFGVISLQGTAQAKQIEKALLDRIAPEEWVARDLRCGDSADFQGSERNVMFLSMVAAPESDRRLMPLTTLMYLQRYNVAASRAKDQMWLFHSIDLSELTNTEDMRFQLLDYCYGSVGRSTQVDTLFQNPVPEDIRVPPFDSLFEQRVFNILIDRGYTVVPQFEVEGYRIDLVVLGSKTKVAIECDGDFWHGPDRYEADLARKRDLERNNWRFFNVRESFFYVDRAAAMAPLWEMLASLEVHPSGWIRSAEPPSQAGHPSDPVSLRGEGGSHDKEDSKTQLRIGSFSDNYGDQSELAPSPISTGPEADPIGFEDALVSDVTEANVPVIVRDPRPLTIPVSGGWKSMADYERFIGKTTSALDATLGQLVNELVTIVEVEGPVLGERLHQAHVRAAGGQRVGRQIAHALNSAITRAKNQGLLIEENPLSEAGVKPRTYRLPSQPQYLVRELGPRTLEQVPPQELAVVLSTAAKGMGWSDEEAVFRAVLEKYKLRRLTTNAIDHLRRVRATLPG
jgi:DNA polymerase III delta prime subunit